MSRDLGLSNSAYSQWNTKKSKPSNKTLALLAPYLNTTVEYLLSGVEQKENPVPESTELSKDAISLSLDKMSTSDLFSLMSDITDTLKKREAK